MIFPLIVSEEAQGDLAEARAWYEARGAKLGANFVKCVDEAFEGIRKMPALHGKVYGELRQTLIRRFPYAILYRVDLDRITIVAVYHSHRDPRGWQDRA